MKISELLEGNVEEGRLKKKLARKSKHVSKASGRRKAKHGLRDDIEENISSAMAAVVMPMGDNKMQKRNPDGTAKNALDGDSLMAGKKKKASKKKA